MKIQVNAVHFVADNSLISFIQKKLDKLETFYDKITGGEVFLKLDKGDKLNTHKKTIEVKLNLPGSSIFVKEEGETFEAATDIAMDTLTRKVKQYKEKVKGVSREKHNVEVSELVDEMED